ncbi:nucleoredoxin-like protein 2 [Nannochloropsis gaditana CCMP526]|uniref:nucleoredoxin-like protein 2 n=1 Tax=Nannochloropsis gaditana (strain CCMP526) TaxID=1093141 RepID=UPI00029F57C3|nr:nucleoredoxin-like protein 2 [Nannochloropsis gaditana CCMP526]EKU21055.1 nucleoredoxin-like protein 2 [Nannochloropsis gaditana CCMP526]|eukprot:XP_005855299.1 nucleoredoxin-like protein 2 [Nannochloropsis gaditana CCMP526]
MASIKSPKRSPTASTFASYSGLKNSLTLKLVFLAMCACALVAAVHSPEDDGVDVIGTALRGDHGPRQANIMEPSALAVAAPPVAEVPPGPAQDITPEPPLLFPADAQLQDLTGALVNANEALANRSVGLYFGAGWCSMTRAANPGVAAFLRPRESEGVTLVFVSSDTNAESLNEQQASNLWPFAVPFDSPLRLSLKELYGVWSSLEVGKIPGKRRSAIPTVMVVGKDGTELARLEVGARGISELDRWNYLEWKWE